MLTEANEVFMYCMVLGGGEGLEEKLPYAPDRLVVILWREESRSDGVVKVVELSTSRHQRAEVKVK